MLDYADVLGPVHTHAPAVEKIETQFSLFVSLFGTFRLRAFGKQIALSGTKAEALVRYLALHCGQPVTREQLLQELWPDVETELAGPSLNSLTYGLRKLVVGIHGSVAPVLQADGYYQLNSEAGVGVDVTCFDRLVDIGAGLLREGNPVRAEDYFMEALRLYRGDLCAGISLHEMIERERLRGRYLQVLAHLADYHFAQGNYDACLGHAARLLANDPCREDAHRAVMRSYVRLGQRAQALRQFQLCQAILRTELEVTPEPATTGLYEQIRSDPGAV